MSAQFRLVFRRSHVEQPEVLLDDIGKFVIAKIGQSGDWVFNFGNYGDFGNSGNPRPLFTPFLCVEILILQFDIM